MNTRIDFDAGAWLEYLPAWIEATEADRLLAALKRRRARFGPSRSLDVHHGSPLVMGGTCQQHYVHGVPRQSGAAGERISLTFRRLLRARRARLVTAAPKSHFAFRRTSS